MTTMNASRNSATKCFEAGMFTKFVDAVDAARKQFGTLWDAGSSMPSAAYTAVSSNEGRRSVSPARRLRRLEAAQGT